MKRRDFLVTGVLTTVLPILSPGATDMQMRKRTVKRGDVALATEAYGVAHRGTIVLVMGATASMVWWPMSLVHMLVDAGYLVVRFDHRDTGLSTTGAPGELTYNLEDLAGDLIAILDDYGVDSAHFFGMSLGAYVAQLLALTAPGRVKSLVMLSAEPPGLPYEGEGLPPGFMEHFSQMETLDWSDADAVTAFLLGIAELSSGTLRPFDKQKAEERIRLEISRTGTMRSAFNHSMLAADLPSGLTAEQLEAPVLIIHGADDPIISANAARAAHVAIAHSTLMIIPGMGHELLEEDVPAIAEAVVEHCNRVDGQVRRE